MYQFLEKEHGSIQALEILIGRHQLEGIAAMGAMTYHTDQWTLMKVHVGRELLEEGIRE